MCGGVLVGPEARGFVLRETPRLSLSWCQKAELKRTALLSRFQGKSVSQGQCVLAPVCGSLASSLPGSSQKTEEH